MYPLHLLEYLLDLTILTAQGVNKGQLVVESMTEAVNELSEPSEEIVSSKDLFLFVPDKNSLRRLLQRKAARVGLTKKEAEIALNKHLEAMLENLTEEEIKEYREKSIIFNV